MFRALILACVMFATAAMIPAISFAADAPAPTTGEPTAEQLAAAVELLETMHVDSMLADATTKMLDLQLQQNPQIAPFKATMQAFFKKYMSWEALKDDLAKIYSEEFSAAELKELTAFFKTPTGQKMASKQATLMSRGAELGMHRVQEHLPELQQAIQAEAQKNQAGQ